MADNERYLPDLPTGLPEITPDDIKALKRNTRSFEDDFSQLKQDYPEFAQDLESGIEGMDPRYLDIKRAFAAGALYTYLLFKRAAQTSNLEAQFNASANDGGVDGVDPPPSV